MSLVPWYFKRSVDSIVDLMMKYNFSVRQLCSCVEKYSAQKIVRRFNEISNRQYETSKLKIPIESVLQPETLSTLYLVVSR